MCLKDVYTLLDRFSFLSFSLLILDLCVSSVCVLVVVRAHRIYFNLIIIHVIIYMYYSRL